MPAPVMTMTELCAFLRINRATLYQMIYGRKIPYFRIGSDYRFNRKEIEAWLKAQEATPFSPSRRGPKPRYR